MAKFQLTYTAGGYPADWETQVWHPLLEAAPRMTQVAMALANELALPQNEAVRLWIEGAQVTPQDIVVMCQTIQNGNAVNALQFRAVDGTVEVAGEVAMDGGGDFVLIQRLGQLHGWFGAMANAELNTPLMWGWERVQTDVGGSSSAGPSGAGAPSTHVEPVDELDFLNTDPEDDLAVAEMLDEGDAGQGASDPNPNGTYLSMFAQGDEDW